MRTLALSLLLLLAALGASAQEIDARPRPDVVPAPRPPVDLAPNASWQYAAKFVCGTSPPAHGLPTLIARGRCFSQINVHNPSRYQTVSFRKKFAVALPFERPGQISPYFKATLKPDEALQIDCGDIFQHLQLATSAFVEGFVVMETPYELDVDTVYTAGTGSAYDVSSIHTERVPSRRLPATA